MRSAPTLAVATLASAAFCVGLGCGGEDVEPMTSASTTATATGATSITTTSGSTTGMTTGDGDSSATGDGDGTATGDGDGTSTGDGDGTSWGDGDGTTSTGDGDGTGNCGNFQIDYGEPCDGTDLGTSTCANSGFLGGNLSCNSDCTLNTSACTSAQWIDRFESGGLLASPWGEAGDAPWFADDTESNGGTYSARSGMIVDNQTSDLVIRMNFDPGSTLAFSYKTSTESCCDHLQVFYDGVQAGNDFDGENDWTEISIPAPPGDVVVTFRYTKDGSVDSGQDAVWIDDIRSDGTPAPAQCGDGLLIFSEECEGLYYAGRTCLTEGFLGGTITCAAGCTLDTSLCSPATFQDGFESGDFMASPWVQGTWPWAVDPVAAYEGGFSARSSAIPDNGMSEFEVTLTWAADGVVVFALRTDTEEWGDDLVFLIDDVWQDDWSGQLDWSEVTFPVTMGTHTLTWRYEKDSASVTGADAVWIDDVRADALP